MKTPRLALSILLLMGGSVAFADNLDSGSSLAVSSAFNPTGSFWNNTSSETVNGSSAVNVGNFLNDTGAFALNGNVTAGCSTCGVNYMASGGQMFLNNGNTPNFVSNLNFVRQRAGLSITLLYANSAANSIAEFGIYDATSQANAQNNHIVLQTANTINLNNNIGAVYTSGTMFTGVINDGAYNLANGSPYATWGIYVKTCTEGSVSLAQCGTDGDLVTYYMGEPSQLNANQTPYDAAHQHFALFQSGTNASQYYLGVVDLAFTAANPTTVGTAGVEGYGDFSDLIFGVITTGAALPPLPTPTTPLPPTILLMLAGLLAVAMLEWARNIRANRKVLR